MKNDQYLSAIVRKMYRSSTIPLKKCIAKEISGSDILSARLGKNKITF
jgi:hypothetical protein